MGLVLWRLEEARVGGCEGMNRSGIVEAGRGQGGRM